MKTHNKHNYHTIFFMHSLHITCEKRELIEPSTNKHTQPIPNPQRSQRYDEQRRHAVLPNVAQKS